MTFQVSKLPITDPNCPDGSGSVNNPGNPDYVGNGSGGSTGVYVPPVLCEGTLDLTQCDYGNTFEESIAAENLNISGAPVNVFKLLGVHEQGKLVDLVGNGEALNGAVNAFDSLVASWVSEETGMAVLTGPAWLGYDFGTIKTSYGQEAYGPGEPVLQHITSFRITQPSQNKRALQVRVERSNGNFKVEPASIRFTGAGNGSVQGYEPAKNQLAGTLVLTAMTPLTPASATTSFMVIFTSASTEVVGIAQVGQRFVSDYGSFMIVPGTVPFGPDDLFTLPVTQEWFRVDVVNLPDVPTPAMIRIKQSSGSRFWRLVPLSFSGATVTEPWEVDKLELFDYQATRLDDIQDTLFQENRDRDYANASIQVKAAYTPFDAISDLSKFGFQVSDVYTFTTVFASMVAKLGRPIVVGDVLELPSGMEYDQFLRPVKKFLEVTDTGWAADGYTTGWKPVTFRFQATQLIPGQEHRDILGTVDTQKYTIDDSEFFKGVQQIQTGTLTGTEANAAEAQIAVPEKGTNIREEASGTNRFNQPGSYDGVGVYVEDGLPPDGQPYTEGFKLPDVSMGSDGDFFRLNYDPKLNIASRLYKFNGVKNKWTYVETDRRNERSSHRPSQLEVLNQETRVSMTAKKIP